MATFKPHDKYVPLNEETRFYCEAFVGKVKLPDSRNFISWFRFFDDGQMQMIDNEQEIIKRENDQIFGALLIIKKTDVHHYGRYLCRIEIGNVDHRLEMSAWLLGSTVNAESDSITPAMLALGAAIFIILLLFLVKYLSTLISIRHRCDKKLFPMKHKEIVQIREVI